MIRRGTVASGLALVVASTTACGAIERVRGEGDSSGDFSISSTLDQVPATDLEEYTVRVADVDAATEAAGLERPDDPADMDATAQWLAPLTGMPAQDGYVPVPLHLPELTVNSTRDLAAFDDLAGWSLVDVASYADIPETPGPFTYIAGDVDDDTLAHLPEVGDGVRTVGEGEDGNTDLSGSNAVQSTGAPVRMAQRDGQLAVSSSTDAVKDWLTGPSEPLTSDPTVSSLAGALDEAGAISALMSVGHDFSANVLFVPVDAYGPLPQSEFDAVALGWSADDGEPVVTIAYHFADEAAANDSVESLRRVFEEGTDSRGTRLSDSLALEEITAQGPVVTATLSTKKDRAHVDLISQLRKREAPFVHD